MGLPELTFLLNASASMVLEPVDMEIRALRDRARRRPPSAALTPGQAGFWKTVQMAGPVGSLALAGMAVWLHRRWRREAHRRQCQG